MPACEKSRFIGQSRHAFDRGDLDEAVGPAVRIHLQDTVRAAGRDLDKVGDRFRQRIVPLKQVRDVDLVSLCLAEIVDDIDVLEGGVFKNMNVSAPAPPKVVWTLSPYSVSFPPSP